LTKFYSIKDLAIEAGVSYHTVYYYIRKGLIEEIGIMGEDQRVFDEECLGRLKGIVALRAGGKSTRQIREILKEEE
jgi:DNA-binding transcriptional MerR regulator